MMTQYLLCLAIAIHHEAGNQTLNGMIAVGNVIMNRVRDERYPSNACDVTRQGENYRFSEHPRKYECQFTFWCDGKPESEPEPYSLPWVAAAFAYSGVVDLTDGATHYHASYVRPRWADIRRMTASIGAHRFYKL